MLIYQLIKSNAYKKRAKVLKIIEICKQREKKRRIGAILQHRVDKRGGGGSYLARQIPSYASIAAIYSC